jgi:hypothetical protein
VLDPMIIAFDLANVASDSILTKTKLWEQMFDISFLIHIGLTFITAYEHDLEWIVNPFQIALNYCRSTFLIDMLSTLPCLIMGQTHSISFWLKLLRFVHFSRFLKLIDYYLQ